jgi:hypothetical protein
MRIFSLLFLVSLLFLPQFMKSDFKVPPTFSQIPNRPEWQSTPSPEILAILNQPFTYLAHGNQSTVFTSHDGQYVLKLLRYTRSRFPLIHNLKNALHNKPKHDLFTKLNKTLHAAHLAATEASAFTQVVYCHLNLTENQLPLAHLASHTLPLDRQRFILQRKVTPFKEALLAARNNPEEMHQLIDSFIALIHNRSSLDIRNSDPNLGPNFGFLNGNAVEIDFGNYRKAPQQPHEINAYITRLEHWLAKNAPEYKGTGWETFELPKQSNVK